MKKIGKFTVTTTAPKPALSKQNSFSSQSQIGKFTVTTTQHAGEEPSPRGGGGAGFHTRPALEMLLWEQQQQSRMMGEMMGMLAKAAEETRMLREEVAQLRAERNVK